MLLKDQKEQMCDEKRQPDSGHLGDRAHAQPSQAAEKAPPNAHSQADGVLHRPLMEDPGACGLCPAHLPSDSRTLFLSLPTTIVL